MTTPTPKLTPQELREQADALEKQYRADERPIFECELLRDLAAAQEALAAKDTELASVKGHAEAMAKELETIARSFDRYAALDGNYPEHWNSVRGMVDAYRAAHPKE